MTPTQQIATLLLENIKKGQSFSDAQKNAIEAISKQVNIPQEKLLASYKAGQRYSNNH
jgi:hypothetical protein